MLPRELPIMVEILNFSPDKTSVGRGMEVTYTLDMVNRGPTAGVLTATFSEISSDGQRIQRDVRVRTVGSGGTTTFEFTLNVSASPGHVYTVCVDVVKTPRDSGVVVGTDSECDSSVVVSEGSGIIVIESCTVNKTRVDGGATIRYTTRITNRLWAQKVVFLNLWDIDTGESLYTAICSCSRTRARHSSTLCSAPSWVKPIECVPGFWMIMGRMIPKSSRYVLPG